MKKKFRAENLQMREVPVDLPGVKALMVFWDVVKLDGEYLTAFGDRLVFHVNYRDDQMHETITEFLRKLKREWSEATDFPTTFIDKARSEIKRKAKEVKNA